jgi:hypothetical protein
MKTLTIIVSLLVSPLALALTPVTENFDSARLNPLRWQRAMFKSARMDQLLGKLGFWIVAPFDKDEDYAYIELLNNQPGFNENWQVTVAVTNKSGEGDHIGAGFWIYNADDPSDVIFFEFYGNNSRVQKTCAMASFVLNGSHQAAQFPFNRGLLKSAKLRVVFNRQTKLFTFKVGTPNPTRRSRTVWTSIGTFSPTGVGGDARANWNLNPGSGRFGIRLEGYGERRLLDRGKVSMDNFVLAAP